MARPWGTGHKRGYGAGGRGERLRGQEISLGPWQKATQYSVQSPPLSLEPQEGAGPGSWPHLVPVEPCFPAGQHQGRAGPFCVHLHTYFHTPPGWASVACTPLLPCLPLHTHRSSCLMVWALAPGRVFPGGAPNQS